MPSLKYLEIETQTNPIASVIWLHGLGASGHDFEPIVPELRLPLGVRFIFPHAPNRTVTVNGGMVMPAWYDIISMAIERVIDTKQIMESSAAVGEFIEQEIARGIPSEKIFIVGFSQGGAVAYEAALSYSKKLGGLIALSTYFATRKTISISGVNALLPVFIGHGTVDNVVDEVLGQQAKQALTELGYKPEYHTYPIAHSVCMEEITAISTWLQKQLKG
ncbi:MAG: phospholipase/carboxylesterase [Candidatus Endobugula sp.]|jgi:phospholipase/carboxylesterase